LSNTNYLRGRRFEWKRKKAWEKRGYTVIRAAGSKGPWDLVAVREHAPVELIQCKLVKTRAQAKKWLSLNPPILSTGQFHQTMEVWVTDLRELLTWTV
jgi:Holliday junction resolvase